MIKEDERLPAEEIERRLEVARAHFLPERIARLPNDQTWQLLAAFLVNDADIWSIIEARLTSVSKRQKAGRPRLRTPFRLKGLARAFRRYKDADLRREKKGRAALLKGFRASLDRDFFGWLSGKKDTTVENILGEADQILSRRPALRRYWLALKSAPILESRSARRQRLREILLNDDAANDLDEATKRQEIVNFFGRRAQAMALGREPPLAGIFRLRPRDYQK